jgi:hypothetical protein
MLVAWSILSLSRYFNTVYLTDTEVAQLGPT